MPGAERSPAFSGALYILAGAACISFAPLFVRFNDAEPTTVLFYRFLWGGLVLLALAWKRGQLRLPGHSLFCLLSLAALFSTADLASWHQSVLYAGPGLATILCNFQVFFLAAAGMLFLRERPGPRMFLSIPLALFGVWLLLGVDIEAMPDTLSAGLVLGLASAAFYAGYILVLRRSQRLENRLSPVANMAFISCAGALFSALLALAQGQALQVPGLGNNLMLFCYGVSCQAIGILLISKGLPLLPASRAGLLLLLQPVLTFLWDVLFLERQTSASGYAGALLALVAIAVGILDRQKTAGPKARPE